MVDASSRWSINIKKYLCSLILFNFADQLTTAATRFTINHINKLQSKPTLSHLKRVNESALLLLLLLCLSSYLEMQRDSYGDRAAYSHVCGLLERTPDSKTYLSAHLQNQLAILKGILWIGNHWIQSQSLRWELGIRFYDFEAILRKLWWEFYLPI